MLSRWPSRYIWELVPHSQDNRRAWEWDYVNDKFTAYCPFNIRAIPVGQYIPSLLVLIDTQAGWVKATCLPVCLPGNEAMEIQPLSHMAPRNVVYCKQINKWAWQYNPYDWSQRFQEFRCVGNACRNLMNVHFWLGHVCGAGLCMLIVRITLKIENGLSLSLLFWYHHWM